MPQSSKVLPGSRPLIIAHRGARAFAPENTLAAFAKAAQLQADMIELDVRLSRDGVVVVHHDVSVLRCTDAMSRFPDRADYDLAAFSYAELSKLDAGSWYVQELQLPAQQRQAFLQTLGADELSRFLDSGELTHYESGTVKIPTLKQTLELAKDLQLQVNIELKEHSEAIAMTHKVIKLVKRLAMTGQVIISSFDHSLLAEVRRLSTKLPTAVLTAELLADPVDYLQTLKANAYNHGCCSGHSDKDLLAGQIQALRSRNLGVNAWTCNDPKQIDWLITAGVSGIISDFPNRVQKALTARLTQFA